MKVSPPATAIKTSMPMMVFVVLVVRLRMGAIILLYGGSIYEKIITNRAAI
jgi:hypothetical protein